MHMYSKIERRVVVWILNTFLICTRQTNVKFHQIMSYRQNDSSVIASCFRGVVLPRVNVQMFDPHVRGTVTKPRHSVIVCTLTRYQRRVTHLYRRNGCDASATIYQLQLLMKFIGSIIYMHIYDPIRTFNKLCDYAAQSLFGNTI